MADYERIPSGDEQLPGQYGLVDQKYGGPSPSYTAPASLLKPLVFALLLLNVLLAGTNVWATNALSAAVMKVAPVADISQLPAPDQYVGLSTASRQKMVHADDGAYIRKRDPADFMRNPL